jgi:biopolymer transport protein ExbD
MSKRAVPEINAGSMADIAFLLLIFFLVTTTMDVDTGIIRKLPPPVEKNQDDVEVKDRNVLKILVNSHDQLLVDGERGDISTLKNKVKDFMALHPDNEQYPEVKPKFIKELNKEVMLSKGVISLKNDRGTSYGMYIKVQNELAKAFNEMKDEKSLQMYGVKYKQLVDEKKVKVINKLVPVPISEAEPENVGGE